MAKQKSNHWSVGTLHSRGWTDDLIKELLGDPTWHYFHGRRVRCWRREDILTAEKDERFAAAAAAEKSPRCIFSK